MSAKILFEKMNKNLTIRDYLQNTFAKDNGNYHMKEKILRKYSITIVLYPWNHRKIHYG